MASLSLWSVLFLTLSQIMASGSVAFLPVMTSSACPASMRRCIDGNCIPAKWFCDKELDCGQGDDESIENCGSPVDPAPADPVAMSIMRPPAIKDCSSDQHFYCDGFCIPVLYRCNGIADCADGNDEKGCIPSSPFVIEDDEITFTCEDYEVRCFDNKKCIPFHQICDGYKHCSTGEDEFGCSYKTANKVTSFDCIRNCLGVDQPCNTTRKSVRLPPTLPPPTTTTTATTVRPTVRRCPENMNLVLDRCIYVNVAPPRSWRGARQWCSQYNWTLVEIDSGNFFVSLVKFLNTTDMDSYTYWVGANDKNVEGRWIWDHSGNPVVMGTPLWTIATEGDSYVQQPAGGRTENCAVLENCPFQYLNDISCEEKRGFLCQHGGFIEYYNWRPADNALDF